MRAEEIRIAIADDERLVAEALEYALGLFGFEIVGSTRNGPGALEIVKREKPDILVLDLFMPGMDGFDVVKAIRDQNVNTKVLVLTSSSDPEDVVKAARLGVAGYAAKDIKMENLHEMLISIAEGKRKFDAVDLDQLFSWESETLGAQDFGLIDPLTEQEDRVLRMIAKGLSNEQIAVLLNVSVNTVKTHVRHVYEKLAVGDRTSAVLWGIHEGPLTVQSDADSRLGGVKE